MAKFGLICAKLRINGMHAAAEIIEKTQEELDDLRDECDLLRRERDAWRQHYEKLMQERDKLLRERDVLNEIARTADMECENCAHNSNQDEGCELDEHDCPECSRTDCYCRDCRNVDKWEWKGLEE